MPVGQNPLPTLRYGATILTSDPATGVIEAALKGADARRVLIFGTPVAFRWPVPGEQWTIRQENGTWYLDSPIPLPTQANRIEAADPGDVILHSPTGVVRVEGSADGSTDFVLTKPGASPGGGGFDAAGLHFTTADFSDKHMVYSVADAIDHHAKVPFSATAFSVGSSVGVVGDGSLKFLANGWYQAGFQGQAKVIEIGTSVTGSPANGYYSSEITFDLICDTWQYLTASHKTDVTLAWNAGTYDRWGSAGVAQRTYVSIVTAPFYGKTTDAGVYLALGGQLAATSGETNPSRPTLVAIDASPTVVASPPPGNTSPVPSNWDGILWVRRYT